MTPDLVQFGWGFFFGVLLPFVVSLVWTWSRFERALDMPCMACGRPSAALAQIVDLETRRSRELIILCDPCSKHVRNTVVEHPAPWMFMGETRKR